MNNTDSKIDQVSSDRLDAATNQNFTSWQQFFGPQEVNGDNFTTVVSENLMALFLQSLITDIATIRPSQPPLRYLFIG